MLCRIALPVPDLTRYANYADVLSALGALPVGVGADVDAAGFDGLLLPGGGDIAPSRYGQADAGCVYVDPALDDMQFAALNAFVKAGKPVLGICRGHQLINVYFGGTLIQHLAQAAAHSRGGGSEDKVHATTAAPGSALYNLYGAAFPVNSSHHQGVDRLGEGLAVTQRSDDGVIEGMAHEHLPILCVQWHPERMCLAHARTDTVEGSAVVGYFLERCARV